MSFLPVVKETTEIGYPDLMRCAMGVSVRLTHRRVVSVCRVVMLGRTDAQETRRKLNRTEIRWNVCIDAMLREFLRKGSFL